MGNHSSGIHKDIIPLLYEKENGSAKRGTIALLVSQSRQRGMGNGA
jgi:hypothetical protein